MHLITIQMQQLIVNMFHFFVLMSQHVIMKQRWLTLNGLLCTFPNSIIDEIVLMIVMVMTFVMN